jgi:hypothetical protein
MEGVAQGEARAYPCSCDDDHDDDDDELASLTGSEDRSWSCSPSTRDLVAYCLAAMISEFTESEQMARVSHAVLVF